MEINVMNITEDKAMNIAYDKTQEERIRYLMSLIDEGGYADDESLEILEGEIWLARQA
jgi:hypothetical protein